MPHLNRLGRAAYGTSTVGIMGATPAALAGQVAGAQFGPSWYDSDGPRIVYQNGGTGSGPWILQSYNESTLATATVSATGQNFMAAGGGQWGKWLAGSGVSSSITIGSPTAPLADADLLDVSNDGDIALCDVRATATGISVYDSSGTKISPSTLNSTVVLSGRTTRLVSGRLSYQSPTGWHIYTISETRVPLWRPRLDGVNWLVPVVASDGTLFVMERTEFITVRQADSALAYTITASTGIGFNPDAVEISPGVIRVAYCTDLGESINSLVLVDITMSTGDTSVGVVSGGGMVFSAGPTLTKTDYPVGPPEGNKITGQTYWPYQHPVTQKNDIITEPWLRAFRGLSDSVQTVGLEVQNSAANVPHDPSFGIVAGDVTPSVNATAPNDTLALTSVDASVTLTGNPITKTVDVAVNRSVVVGAPVGRRGESGRMGVPGPAGPMGATGVAGPMGPPPRRSEDVTRVVMVPNNSGFTGSFLVPLSLGIEPLTFVSDGAGQAIFVWYTP